jgi:hypothetical protein
LNRKEAVGRLEFRPVRADYPTAKPRPVTDSFVNMLAISMAAIGGEVKKNRRPIGEIIEAAKRIHAPVGLAHNSDLIFLHSCNRHFN